MTAYIFICLLIFLFFFSLYVDAPPPIWEQLEKGLVAVKTVVHGLVDFIQNHSKKGADPQQVSLKHFKNIHQFGRWWLHLFLGNEIE